MEMEREKEKDSKGRAREGTLARCGAYENKTENGRILS